MWLIVFNHNSAGSSLSAGWRMPAAQLGPVIKLAYSAIRTKPAAVLTTQSNNLMDAERPFWRPTAEQLDEMGGC